jgi:hypothetical protein
LGENCLDIANMLVVIWCPGRRYHQMLVAMAGNTREGSCNLLPACRRPEDDQEEA